MEQRIAPEKEAALHAILRSYGRVAIGFSGGVDSTLLLRLSLDLLGRDNVLALIADTPSLPRRELQAALELAAGMGANCQVVPSSEFEDEAYLANTAERCYICKRHLFSALQQAAAQGGYSYLLDGNNADDSGDFRPGRRALKELGVASPLMEAGLTKDDVRALSRHFGLPTAEKPAMACLASRIPYGTRLDTRLLAQIERAENALRDAGFVVCRLRHHGDVARIEVAPEEIDRFFDREIRRKVAAAIMAAGYQYVTLDLLGYRMGSLNEVLPPEQQALATL